MKTIIQRKTRLFINLHDLGQVNAEIKDKSSELLNKKGLEPKYLGDWIQVSYEKQIYDYIIYHLFFNLMKKKSIDLIY